MMACRHCAAPLVHSFLDLGFTPPSNAYLTRDDVLTKRELRILCPSLVLNMRIGLD